MIKDALPPLRDVIAEHGLAAKRSLGQNFLLDLNLTAKIARAAGAGGGGTFYEVGPGPGGLTRALLKEGADKVIAVERDERCLPALEEIAAAIPANSRSFPPTRCPWRKARSCRPESACRRQSALQCGNSTSGQMAYGEALAALVEKPHSNVPAGSGRADHRQAGQ